MCIAMQQERVYIGEHAQRAVTARKFPRLGGPMRKRGLDGAGGKSRWSFQRGRCTHKTHV